MDVLNYAVSIQYGKGLHHWVRTDIVSELEALTLSTATKRQVKGKKGPKTTVHLWKRITSFGEVPASKTEAKSGIIL